MPQAELIVRRVYGVGGAGIVNRHRAGPQLGLAVGRLGLAAAAGRRRGGVPRAAGAGRRPGGRDRADPRATLAAVSSPFRTAERFGVQDLIDPRETRPLLCAWVRDAYRVLPALTGRPSFGTRP